VAFCLDCILPCNDQAEKWPATSRRWPCLCHVHLVSSSAQQLHLGSASNRAHCFACCRSETERQTCTWCVQQYIPCCMFPIPYTFEPMSVYLQSMRLKGLVLRTPSKLRSLMLSQPLSQQRRGLNRRWPRLTRQQFGPSQQ